MHIVKDHSGRIIATGLLCLAILATSVQATADSYVVTFLSGRSDDDGAMRRARVEATLTPDRGYVGFYRAGPDTGLYHEWATFLLNIKAKDANGKALALDYEPNGRWQVKGWRSGEITLTYDMALQHDRFFNEPGDNELASAHPYGVMWSTRALLLEGAPSSDININFPDLPETWAISSPWQRTPDVSGWSFHPRDTSDLLDSAFVAGEHFERNVPIGETGGLRIALGPPVKHFDEIFTPLFSAYLNYYSKLFGKAPEDTILVIGLDASFLGGGVMGRTISLSLTEDLTAEMAAPIAGYIVSHEGFHLWNSTWGEPDDTQLQWLSEGSAEYYGFLGGVRLGFFDEEVFFSQLAEKYSNYLDSLRSGESILSASLDKHGTPQNYSLIYDGGMALSTLLDLEIRARSDNEKSLDTLVADIHARYGGGAPNKANLRNLGRLIKADYGVDFDRLARAHLKGRTPIDLSNALAFVGYEIAVTQGPEGYATTISPVDSPTKEQQEALLAWGSGLLQ